MIGPHYTLAATLEVLTPLHVGTGEVWSVPLSPSNSEETEVSMVALDHAGAPYLPGSSIKGLLRVLAGSGREPLFGPDTIVDQTKAFAGHVIVWNARLLAPPADMSHAPWGNKDVRGDSSTLGSRGLYVEARTAIDPETGVADDHKLFHRTFVAPGTTFHLEFTLQHGRSEHSDMPALARQLASLLSRMGEDDGVALGSGTRTGQGRVRLDTSTLSVASAPQRFEGDAEVIHLLRTMSAELPEVGATMLRRKLHFVCDGPYLVGDSSKTRKQTSTGEQSKEPHLHPLVEPAGDRPRLPGTTLTGALRTRALWLAAVRDRAADDKRDRVLRPRDDPATLSTVERLFGVSGWRGLVSIDAIRYVGEARPLDEAGKDITSVRLDRFSGAPIDGGLFTTRAWLDPTFEVVLSLHDRPRSKGDQTALSEGDRALFAALLEDLAENGIMLGHGTNKGYGWFTVTMAEGDET